MNLTWKAALALLVAACAATPSGPPEKVAADIVAALEEGRADDARRLFAAVERDDAYRERIYPVAFGAAREHFEEGDVGPSTALLRFLAGAYPDAAAVREALCYSLFLERARMAGDEAADRDALARELAAAVGALRERAPSPPVWIHLIAAQNAIDRGRLEEAREAYARFRAGWNGSPATLTVYADDVGRYLDSH